MFETAVLSQILRDLRSPIAERELERRESAEILFVHLRAARDEEFHNVKVSAANCFMQRGCSSVAIVDGSRIGLNQRADFFGFTSRGCVLQFSRLRREDAKSGSRNPEK